MSSKQVDRAVRRAASRDRKRQPKMKVSGKGLFAIQRLIKGK